MLRLPYFLALKAEALHIADRTFESLEAISEAEALVERFEDRHWCADGQEDAPMPLKWLNKFIEQQDA